MEAQFQRISKLFHSKKLPRPWHVISVVLFCFWGGGVTLHGLRDVNFQRGLNPVPWQWKCWVLNIELSGNSSSCIFDICWLRKHHNDWVLDLIIKTHLHFIHPPAIIQLHIVNQLHTDGLLIVFMAPGAKSPMITPRPLNLGTMDLNHSLCHWFGDRPGERKRSV